MERQPGYYWVKTKYGPWCICQWLDGSQFWYAAGDDLYVDSDIEEINETRILSPDEANTTFFCKIATVNGVKDISIQLPVGLTLPEFGKMGSVSV